MAHYLLLYRGKKLPDDVSERQTLADEWATWEREAGGAILDSGSPIINGLSASKNGSLSIDDPCTSYTIIEAANQDEATELARSAPQLTDTASVDIYKLSDSD